MRAVRVVTIVKVPWLSGQRIRGGGRKTGQVSKTQVAPILKNLVSTDWGNIGECSGEGPIVLRAGYGRETLRNSGTFSELPDKCS